MLSTGKMSLGGLFRHTVVRINDHPDMTSVVYCGRKHQIKQTKYISTSLSFYKKLVIFKHYLQCVMIHIL